MFQFNATQPIYIQMIDIFKLKIISGEWEKGARVPPVRDLALQYGVNPNTMQRSLSELEREGLMYTERTSGRFITKDCSAIENEKKKMADIEIRSFLGKMSGFGYTTEEITRLIEDAAK